MTSLTTATSKIVIHSIFQKYDKDHSNQIEMSEFQNLLGDLGLQYDELVCKTAFLQIDKEKNGKISFEEFYDWWKSEEKFKHIDHNIKAVTQATQIFFKYDKDRSGFLDVKEFQLCLAEFAKAEKKEFEVEKIVKALDKNGDGKIDFGEFMAWLNWMK